MSYEIITDSCCDFTQEQYRAAGISRADLTLLLEDREQANFTDPCLVKEFYDKLRQGHTATTSAANPEHWQAILEPALEQGRDVLALCFSSGLSTTYQSAVIAAGELAQRYPRQKIHVCDSLCAALGQGFLVDHACRLRAQGMDFDSLCQWVEEQKGRVCHWFTVDDLNHLRRGGRVSTATALVGTMLNVKPILHMDDTGHLINVAKVRGRKASVEYLGKKVLESAASLDRVFIGHGDCPEDAAHLEAILKAGGAREILTGYVGPVIGAHTGPGVLAVFFFGEQR